MYLRIRGRFEIVKQNGLRSLLHRSSTVVSVAQVHSAVRTTLLEPMGRQGRRRKCGEDRIPAQLRRREVRFREESS